MRILTLVVAGALALAVGGAEASASTTRASVGAASLQDSRSKCSPPARAKPAQVKPPAKAKADAKKGPDKSPDAKFGSAARRALLKNRPESPSAKKPVTKPSPVRQRAAAPS